MKNMKKTVSVVGHFGLGENLLNGQTIKTKNVTAELEKQLGESEVFKIDTHGGILSFLKLPFWLLKGLRKCRNVIIMPAQRGIQFIAPILICFNHLFHRKLHYCVIGGWLPEMLRNKGQLSNCLKKFDGIYVETRTMKYALNKVGFNNVIVMPNFKDLAILKPEELSYQTEPPYKLCTFSRVMREKGVEDAINAVKLVNEETGHVVYTLDIYGQIESGYKMEFAALQESFPTYVRYRGAVPSEKSVETLKEYFALLFPTHFFTEGIPGTIIDAYAAGVPVISSRWESFSDVIEDGITGIGFSFGKPEAMKEIFRDFLCCPQKLTDMRSACLHKAQTFTPGLVIQALLCHFA